MTMTDERHARMFLVHATEPPVPAVHNYVAVHGPVEAVAHIRDRSAPATVLGEIKWPNVRVDSDLSAVNSGDARFLTPEDDEWPAAALNPLAGCGIGPPLGLWVRGTASLAELTDKAVTMTGSRASTSYGEHMTAILAEGLSRDGVAVISGGALGIEGAAHKAVVTIEGRTVVVLPCGVDQCYPLQHSELFRAVLRCGGLLVSEYPPGTRPFRVRFYARQRLLAALGAATIIVEAGVRSGALVAADVALALGRRVYGVPGRITGAASTGVHALLRAGKASPVSSADQISRAHDA